MNRLARDKGSEPTIDTAFRRAMTLSVVTKLQRLQGYNGYKVTKPELIPLVQRRRARETARCEAMSYVEI